MTVHVVLAYKSGSESLPPGALVIADARACFEHLPKIERAAKDASQNLTVVVRDASAAGMLAFLRGRPGIEMRDADPRAELGERWRCQLPAALTPAAIEALRLFEMPPPPGGDVIGAILFRAYGDDLFLSPVLDPAREVRLLGLLVTGHPYAEAAPVVNALLRERLRTWGEQGSHLAMVLAANPTAAPWYLIGSVLRRYPAEVRNAVMDALVHSFGTPPDAKVGVDTLPMPEPEDLPPAIRHPLEVALWSHLFTLPLTQYLGAVSGVLPAELDVLVERAAHHPGAIDIKSARSAFRKLDRVRTTSSLDRLEQRWQAIAALDFQIDKTTAQKRPADAFTLLARFYTNQYLAAKEVYKTDPEANERLLEWNEAYAEWLVGNYHRLLVAQTPEHPLFAFDCLRQRLQALLAEGKVPIVLAVDGLAWPAFLRLRRAAERAGLFQLGEPWACLAPLPTITQIAMTALIAGGPPAAIAQRYPERGNWRAARDACFCERYPGAQIGRANNPTQLREALAKPAPVYLLYAFAVDDRVHDPEFDDELIERWLDVHFEVLFRALTDAADYPHLRGQLRDLVLVVVTDHGYTDLVRDGTAQLPVEVQVSPELMRVDTPHHCALEATLPPADTDTGALLRTRLADDWYIIEGEGFGLPTGPVWLLPKRQQRVRGSARRVHGRPSLEETIVPLAEFSLCRPEGLQLALNIQGRLVKGEARLVHLAVTNLAVWPARDLRVEIPELGVSASIGRVDPGGTEVIPVEARARRSGQFTLQAYVSSPSSQRQRMELQIAVERSEAERLLGEDRIGSLLGEEDW